MIGDDQRAGWRHTSEPDYFEIDQAQSPHAVDVGTHHAVHDVSYAMRAARPIAHENGIRRHD